jgi:hypothetical protein
MPNEQKKMLPIDYTATEFESIRKELLQVAERFYPDTFRDFSDASFGAMMVDAVAYVGDQLSFYLDYNVNETFLDTAYQYNNILRHGRILGYKHLGPASSYGTVSIFIMVPASNTALGPDTRYLPVLKRGTRFSSTSGMIFTLTENVDFSNPKFQVVVARTNTTTGAPTHYAIKAYATVVSGNLGVKRIRVNDYERFLRVKLKVPNVQEVISVLDSEGNEYFEVDYLSQDIVYKEISNKNFKNDNVPSILKPMLVSRKFVVERTRNATYLQFGSGKQGESNVAADPQSVAIDLFGKDYVTDTSFDPTKLSRNENFGIVPSNTILTVTYRGQGSGNANVAVGKLNNVSTVLADFANRQALSSTTIGEVERSIEVSNEEPITGQTRAASSSEVKRRIYDTFPTQNRAVTKADYESIVYRMPAKFGSVKRCSVQKDPDSMKRNLNMYVISEDNFGLLTKSNSAIKNNLKTWLDNYRMINDTIDILDAHIFNFGIEFTVSAAQGANKFTLLSSCVTQLKKHFSYGFYIGESISISDIYSELKKVTGVADVNFVKIVNKTGTTYSNVFLNINKNTSPDGTTMIVPGNVVPEIKFPRTDIKGKII